MSGNFIHSLSHFIDSLIGGGLVENESMYYRQFGEADSPLHLFKDKDGNFIPNTARSSGEFVFFFISCSHDGDGDDVTTYHCVRHLETVPMTGRSG